MTTKEHRSGILETIQATWYNGQNMIAAYQPDIVLLQIGTNDILSNYNDGITDRLENLVNVILQDLDADSTVFVSTIPDIDAYTRADWLGSYGINAWGSTQEEKDRLMETVTGCIDTYNTSIYNLVLKMQSEGKNVQFADINSVVDYQTDLHDGVHPNEAGYENMGNYWAGLLNDFFQNNGTNPKPVTTTTTTQPAVTTTTTTTTTKATTKPITTTSTAKTTTTTKATTTTTAVTVPDGATEIHLTGVKKGESYSLANYPDATAISFTFSGNLQYIGGAFVLGNWTKNQSYNANDLNGNTLTFPIDMTDIEQKTFTFFRWNGGDDIQIEDVTLYCGTAPATTPEVTTTTAKPTTTTTTTTTTAKPTTTTTTTTTTANADHNDYHYYYNCKANHDDYHHYHNCKADHDNYHHYHNCKTDYDNYHHYHNCKTDYDNYHHYHNCKTDYDNHKGYYHDCKGYYYNSFPCKESGSDRCPV